MQVAPPGGRGARVPARPPPRARPSPLPPAAPGVCPGGGRPQRAQTAPAVGCRARPPRAPWPLLFTCRGPGRRKSPPGRRAAWQTAGRGGPRRRAAPLHRSTGSSGAVRDSCPQWGDRGVRRFHTRLHAYKLHPRYERLAAGPGRAATVSRPTPSALHSPSLPQTSRAAPLQAADCFLKEPVCVKIRGEYSGRQRTPRSNQPGGKRSP
jgi:hypothetical protein